MAHKYGTWGWFKGEVERQGVKDDDAIFSMDGFDFNEGKRIPTIHAWVIDPYASDREVKIWEGNQ